MAGLAKKIVELQYIKRPTSGSLGGIALSN